MTLSCMIPILLYILRIYRDDDFCQLFNWFQIIFCENEILEIAGHSQNSSKMTLLKWGVDSFSSLFSLIFSYFIFDRESSL